MDRKILGIVFLFVVLVVGALYVFDYKERVSFSPGFISDPIDVFIICSQNCILTNHDERLACRNVAEQDCKNEYDELLLNLNTLCDIKVPEIQDLCQNEKAEARRIYDNCLSNINRETKYLNCLQTADDRLLNCILGCYGVESKEN